MLGCMYQAAQSGNRGATCSSISVHAFTNHHVSVKNRLIFFHVVVTSVATFAAGHRTIFQQELAAHDVAHRKLLRSVIAWGYGPVTFLARNPARLERVSFNFCGPSWLETLFTHMLEQHGTLAHHAVNLPRDRWLYAGYGIGNLSAGADGRPTLDITYRWRAAPKAFFCQQTDSLWQATASRSSASLPWPGQCCLFSFWPWNKPDERLVQAGRCFSQNDTYDRQAATFCSTLLIIKHLEDPITIVISITLNVIWACIVNRWKQNSSARDLCLHDQLFQVFQCILYFNHSPAKQQQLFFLPPIGRWWGRGHLKKRAIDPGGWPGKTQPCFNGREKRHIAQKKKKNGRKKKKTSLSWTVHTWTLPV